VGFWAMWGLLVGNGGLFKDKDHSYLQWHG
jgi:hypothetical protein